MGVSCVFPGFIRDAGMFADSGVKLPPGVGTRSPEDVADAVVSTIERDRGEVDVAPSAQRAGARRREPGTRTSRRRWYGGSAAGGSLPKWTLALRDKR